MPTAQDYNALAGMGFVNYGDGSIFLHFRDTFSRYPSISFIGTKKKKEQTSAKVVNAALTNWVSFSGTPVIISTDKDSRCTWSKFSQFRKNERIITVQKVIRGSRQSVRSTERRRMYFKDIMRQIIEKIKKIGLTGLNGCNSVGPNW